MASTEQNEGRLTNARRNAIWAFFSKIIMLIVPFITRTLFVYKLGTEYLGLSSLLTSILQVLNLAELGFSSAIVYCMYEPIAKDDKQTVVSLLAYFKKIYRVVGAVILGLGLVVLAFLDVFISGDVPSDVDPRLAFALYLTSSVMSYLLFAYRQSIVAAYQRNDLIQKVALSTQLFGNGLQIVILIFVPNFYLIAAVLIITTILNNLLIAYISNKHFPAYFSSDVKAGEVPADTKGNIRKQVTGILIQRLCVITRDTIDSIVISSFLGLALVGMYGNYSIIMAGILGVLGVIGPAITSSVGNSIVLEDREKNFNDLRLLVFLYAILSTIALACMFALFQPFMQIWMGTERMLPFSVVILLSIYFYVRTMGDMLSVYVDAAGIWWDLKHRAVIETIVNVVLDVTLIQVLGLPGVVLATIISLLVVNFGYGSVLIFRIYFQNGKVGVYFLDHLKYALGALVISVGTFFAVSLVPGSDLLSFAGKLAVAAVCSVALTAVLYVWTKTFKRAFPIMKRIIRG